MQLKPVVIISHTAATKCDQAVIHGAMHAIRRLSHSGLSRGHQGILLSAVQQPRSSATACACTGCPGQQCNSLGMALATAHIQARRQSTCSHPHPTPAISASSPLRGIFHTSCMPLLLAPIPAHRLLSALRWRACATGRTAPPPAPCTRFMCAAVAAMGSNGPAPGACPPLPTAAAAADATRSSCASLKQSSASGGV